MSYVSGKDFISIGNQRYSVLLLGIQDLVFCVQVLFSENTKLGIGRIPRSFKIAIEAARLLEKEIIRIADFCSFVAWNWGLKTNPIPGCHRLI